MKISGKQTIGENLLYMMVWTAIILVPVLNSLMMSELHVKWVNVWTAWQKIIPYLLVFIIHNGILAPRYMLRHKYWKYLLSTLVVLTAVFLLAAFYDELLPSAPVEIITKGGKTPKPSFTDLAFYWNLILGFFMAGVNSSIKLMYQSIRDEQQMEELKQQNMQAEMDYLKYQINPHFFMNTLNNIHALIDIDAQSAQNALIELSKMMRYVLYESGHAIISLDRDIQFVKNYIGLMRIRYTDVIDIRIDYPQNIAEKISIPPLLLIVFVENAFKHGVSHSGKSFIHLDILYENGKVVSTISNSRRTSIRKKEAGIGLDNVRKRLDLIYGAKNYTLDIREEPAAYIVQLTIPTLETAN